ncbi:hypothetical protein FRB99_005329, partial [Tulasnella sp. 403]
MISLPTCWLVALITSLHLIHVTARPTEFLRPLTPSNATSHVRRSFSAIDTQTINAAMAYVHYARTAYCPTDSVLKWDCGESCIHAGNTFVLGAGGDSRSTPRWYVGYNPDTKAIVIAHEGTTITSLSSVSIPSNVRLVSLRDYEKGAFSADPSIRSQIPPNLDVKVHKGYIKAQADTSNAIYSLVAGALAQQAVKYKDARGTERHGTVRNVVTVGYSMGAALAVFDLLYLYLKTPIKNRGLFQWQTFTVGLPLGQTRMVVALPNAQTALRSCAMHGPTITVTAVERHISPASAHLRDVRETMGNFQSRGDPSRKFTDLIYKASSRFPNWEPPIRIKVGDWGLIDRKSGEFNREGNIFDDEQLMAELPDLAKLKVTISAPETKYIVGSESVVAIDLGLSPELNVAGLGGASVKGKWKFQKGTRGALLVMAQPRLTHIPDEVLRVLSKCPRMLSKAIVISVYDCPAYVMYMSDKSGNELTVSMNGSLPIPQVPGLAAGGGAEMGWSSSYSGGIYRESFDGKGENLFTPLFHPKDVPRPVRGTVDIESRD